MTPRSRRLLPDPLAVDPLALQVDAPVPVEAEPLLASTSPQPVNTGVLGALTRFAEEYGAGGLPPATSPSVSPETSPAVATAVNGAPTSPPGVSPSPSEVSSPLGFDPAAYGLERPVYDDRRAKRLRTAGLLASVAGIGAGLLTGEMNPVTAIAQGIAGGATKELDEMDSERVTRGNAFAEGIRQVALGRDQIQDREAGREATAELAEENRLATDARAEGIAEAAADRLERQLEAAAEEDRLDALEKQAASAWEVGDVDAYTSIMTGEFGADETATRSAIEARAAQVTRAAAIQDRDYQLRVRAAGVQEGNLAVSRARLAHEQSRPRPAAGSSGGRATGGRTTGARRTAAPTAAPRSASPAPSTQTVRRDVQDGGRFDAQLDRVASRIQGAPPERARAALAEFVDSLADDVAAGTVDQETADVIEAALLDRLGY
ncbi:MAG TPA: hypothetical protein VGB53_01620 [Rubricoccaceae bacterium]|jgi:F0F1-type ATP synthase membrane subunit c/vacuolar-type H+-ATPase subunit K